MVGMHYIKWGEHLETGVPIIDDEHKMLVDILNELFTACFVGQGESHLKSILERLLASIRDHFTQEEDYLAAQGDSTIEEHKAEHETFLERITHFHRSTEDAVEENLSHDALSFLHDWIVDHLSTESQELALISTARAS